MFTVEWANCTTRKKYATREEANTAILSGLGQDALHNRGAIIVTTEKGYSLQDADGVEINAGVVKELSNVSACIHAEVIDQLKQFNAVDWYEVLESLSVENLAAMEDGWTRRIGEEEAA